MRPLDRLLDLLDQAALQGELSGSERVKKLKKEKLTTKHTKDAGASHKKLKKEKFFYKKISSSALKEAKVKLGSPW